MTNKPYVLWSAVKSNGPHLEYLWRIILTGQMFEMKDGLKMHYLSRLKTMDGFLSKEYVAACEEEDGNEAG